MRLALGATRSLALPSRRQTVHCTLQGPAHQGASPAHTKMKAQLASCNAASIKNGLAVGMNDVVQAQLQPWLAAMEQALALGC